MQKENKNLINLDFRILYSVIQVLLFYNNDNNMIYIYIYVCVCVCVYVCVYACKNKILEVIYWKQFKKHLNYLYYDY